LIFSIASIQTFLRESRLTKRLEEERREETFSENLSVFSRKIPARTVFISVLKNCRVNICFTVDLFFAGNTAVRTIKNG